MSIATITCIQKYVYKYIMFICMSTKLVKIYYLIKGDKLMKKFISIALALVMVLACTSVMAEGRAMEDLTVGFANSGTPNPWMTALYDSMAKEAEIRGVKYIATDANNDMVTHNANIEDMLNQGLDYLVVAPMENTGLESSLELAEEMGVPVILSGRTTTGTHVTTVYSDQAWEGERCAEIVGAYKADAKVVEMRGIEGTSSVEGRAAGFRKIMEEQFPEMEIISEQTANFIQQEALDAMTNVLQAKGADAIDAVFCHNDGMALGVVQAIKDAGLTPGVDIVVVTIDGQKEALQGILDGEILGCVQCSPLHGPTVFDVIAAMENGETPEEETIVPDKVMTPENAEDMWDFVF